MRWRCLHLPWHRIVARKRLSFAAEYFRCSCGEEYAINHDVQAVLLWASVRILYEGKVCGCMPERGEPK